MIDLNYMYTESFNIICPYCKKENSVTRLVETSCGYNNDTEAYIDDFKCSCDYCHRDMYVKPIDSKIEITKYEVEKVKIPKQMFYKTDKIFIKSEEKVFVVEEVELLYDKVWVYTLSNGKKYTTEIYELQGTGYKEKVTQLEFWEYMKL